MADCQVEECCYFSYSDLKLTMKNYTDAGQLPLQEVMDSLPGYGIDTRIDS
jgi:hypothetical protein